MKKHSRHIIGEGYLKHDMSRSELQLLAFPDIKGKCNGAYLFSLPKNYRRKKYRLWVEEIPGRPTKEKQ